MENISKVTIPLQEYINMKDELCELRSSVEKKTVYVKKRSTASEWFDVGLVLFLASVMVALSVNF